MRNGLTALLTAGALAFAQMVAAEGLTDMTDAEREAFRAEVRTYLIENPEVLVEAIDALEARQSAEQATNDGNLVAANMSALHDTSDSWVGGNPEGDVTLVEFLDYRCGYCRKAHDDVAKLLSEDGNIRLIVKEFPILGEESVESSRFAIAVLREAGPDAYKEAHDKLMTLRAKVTGESLRAIADDLGLDADAIMATAGSDEVSRVIAENHALAKKMQISGTPTFVMNDMMLRGYLPYDGMVERLAMVRGE
jgi:protein-disulfide isomerase